MPAALLRRAAAGPVRQAALLGLVITTSVAGLAMRAHGSTETQNLALHAPYTLSRPATYDFTNDAGDLRQLTDGALAPDTMWTSQKAVGYGDGSPVTVEIDLGQPRPIGKICVRTARRLEAGASFPRRVDLFLSRNGRGYAWTGRMTPHADVGDGPYLARYFCSEDLARLGRFVRLQVATQGAYFFTDEITVAPSKSAPGPLGGHTEHKLIALGDLRTFAADHEALERLAVEVRTRIPPGENTAPALSRLAQLESALINGTGGYDQAGFEELGQELRRIVQAARAAVGPSVRIARADPWALATPMSPATEASGSDPIDLPTNGYQSVAFDIEHASPEPGTFTVAIEATGEAGASLTVTSSEVGFVTRADGMRLGDPLLPLGNGRMVVPSGETRQLWLDIGARADGPAGRAEVRVTISSDLPGAAAPRKFNIPVQVWQVPQTPAPSTVVWAYLDDIPVRGHELAAVRDLLAHGVDTAVIPAWGHLPWPKADAIAGRSEIEKYARFDKVIEQLKGHRQFLFFLSLNNNSAYRSLAHQFPVLGDAWKALFVAWIKEWSEHMKQAGIGPDRYYMYPVDEPKPGADHDMLVAASQLIKQADPAIRIYTTLHDPDSLTDDVLNAVDVFQLNGQANNPTIIARIQSHGRQAWSYATAGGGKAGDPATFYRAQGWDAFIAGLTGFGFWAYAAAGSSGTAWSDVDDVGPDFAVVYDTPNGPISSKRWAAWREGRQDYAILAAAIARAEGPAAKESIMALALSGRDAISDASQFNKIRRALLSAAAEPPPPGAVEPSALTTTDRPNHAP